MSPPEPKTRAEWREAIPVKIRGKGRDAYVEAECPLCPYVKSVDIHEYESAARAWAVTDVLCHVETTHPECVRG